MKINFIKFNTEIGKNKPATMNSTNNYCPFCHVEELQNIIDTDGDIIFLRNKYTVIDGADQFVLIEGKGHNDMPNYTKEHMRRVIKMGLKHWRELLNSGKYAEVLFFKNFGPMSGGTILHAHMQIVAFPKLDSELLFEEIELEGIEIAKSDGVQINISNKPRVGFGELNIIVEPGGNLDTLADYLQIAVHYLMNHFRKNLTSYNIFFYRQGEKIFAKVMPRFATSPYFVGYNIHFQPTNIYQIADEVKNIYFKGGKSND